MQLSYRTRRTLQRLGVISLILVMAVVIGWLCWVVWLERYVVYTRDGAKIDYSLSAELPVGEVALPPSHEDSVEIYFNEGLNSVEDTSELVKLRGYYIDKDTLAADLESCRAKLGTLPADTPIMIDLKNDDGTFNYSTQLMDGATNGSVDVVAVDDFIGDLNSGKFYTIARIPTFRERNFFLIDNGKNVPYGIPIVGGGGVLWPDRGAYWMDPTDAAAMNWLIQVINEVKVMGFNEIVLSDFRIPDNDKVIFRSDRQEALATAMTTILERCGSDSFAISFGVTNPAFTLPEGSRTRLYLEGVTADRVGAMASQVTIPDPEIRVVFVTTANDTRYESYGVMRPISSSDVLEGMNE